MPMASGENVPRLVQTAEPLQIEPRRSGLYPSVVALWVHDRTLRLFSHEERVLTGALPGL